MTNTLPGEWVELVKRLPGHNRSIDERVIQLGKLHARDAQDVVRGLLFLLESFVDNCDNGDGEPFSIEVDGQMVPVIDVETFNKAAEAVHG